jgi:DNA-binding GntR family transcriptional regulator
VPDHASNDRPIQKTRRKPGVRARHAAMHTEIRDRINLLDYPPGMRLSETELASEFGTSRTPLRRVLARLEEEGLVQSVHGVGTIVTDVNIDELEQTYRLRLELVLLTAKLDPVVPNKAFLDRLDGFIRRSAEIEKTDDPKAFTRLDMDAFQALLELTANEPLREVMGRLYYQTKRIWLNSAIASRLDIKDEFRIFRRELEDIRDALAIEDLEAAAHIQRAHISMSFNRLFRKKT